MELPSFANVISAEAESLTELSLYRMEISNRDQDLYKLKDPLPDHTASYADRGYLYVVNFSEGEDIESELSDLAAENDNFTDIENVTIDLLSQRNWNLTSYVLKEALQYIALSKNNLKLHKGHIYLDEVLEKAGEVEMYPELVTKFIRDTNQKKIYLQVEFKPFLRPHKPKKIHEFTSKPESKRRIEWMEKVVDELRTDGGIRITLNDSTIDFSDYLEFGEEVSRIDA